MGDTMTRTCLCGQERAVSPVQGYFFCPNCDSVQDIERHGQKRKETTADHRLALETTKQYREWGFK